jgi:hypothetical protein
VQRTQKCDSRTIKNADFILILFLGPKPTIVLAMVDVRVQKNVTAYGGNHRVAAIKKVHFILLGSRHE